MKLDVKSFALAAGLIWGVGLFLITWWIIAFEGQAAADARPPFLGLIYRGYAFTTLGSFLGLVWGLVDGLIGGAVFAWVYNALLGRESSAPAQTA